MSILDDVSAAAKGLGRHPQDHGWRELYRLFAYGLRSSAPQLMRTIQACCTTRPASSETHLVTLLGIAIKNTVTPASFDRLIGPEPTDVRLIELELVLARHRQEIGRVLLSRQNSFTAARRFLGPQVLLGARFAEAGTRPCTVNFADLGTGLGIMPRQLNSRTLYERFSRDLVWPGGIPAFRPIPLGSRFGVDRGPMPDLEWVRACYGSSEYYTELYDELVFSLDVFEVRDVDVQYVQVDLLDHDSLTVFMKEHRINAANLCYTLYELPTERRKEVIDTLLGALSPPGVIIVTEPNDELTKPGCTVTLYDEDNAQPHPLCAYSDGHFKGHVQPLSGYRDFIARYPIAFGA